MSYWGNFDYEYLNVPETVKANCAYYAVQLFADAESVAVFQAFYSRGNRVFTINCVDHILASDRILGYDINKLFDKPKLRIINSYFKFDLTPLMKKFGV